MPSQDQIESFIANSFRSVWALDLLRFLADRSGAYFSPAELVEAMRASDAVVSQSVGNLTAAGLAVIDGDEKVALHDASAEQVDLVRAAGRSSENAWAQRALDRASVGAASYRISRASVVARSRYAEGACPRASGLPRARALVRSRLSPAGTCSTIRRP